MISRLHIIILVFILVEIALSSSYVAKSRLMFEYDWPVPKKNLMRFPHPRSCFHFYLTKHDGSHVVKKCNGENEMFDYQSLQCKEKAFAKCWKDVIQRIISKKPKQDFSCPFSWGLYPDIEDCFHFYECLSGSHYLRICPESMAFDKAERTCVPIKEAMCADDADVVEPSYRCPYKWGYFTHPKDCSKYYECLSKVPSVRTCKRNMLFDNIERRCVPMNNVKCGTRINPYERNAFTTEFIFSSSPNVEETTEHSRTEHKRFSSERSGTGFSRFTTERPRTEFSRFTTERPETEFSVFTTEQGTRLITENPKTGGIRFTTDNPGNGHSRFTTEQPGTLASEQPETLASEQPEILASEQIETLASEQPETLASKQIRTL